VAEVPYAEPSKIFANADGRWLWFKVKEEKPSEYLPFPLFEYRGLPIFIRMVRVKEPLHSTVPIGESEYYSLSMRPPIAGDYLFKDFLSAAIFMRAFEHLRCEFPPFSS
jgi:hypothetical protein